MFLLTFAEQGTTFKYQLLELPSHIRIVVPKRGSINDPFKCSLLHIQRYGRPYEALSYEWGLASRDDPFISVDDCTFRVRSNLYDALKHIRLQREDR